MKKKTYARRKKKIIGTAERPRLVVSRSLKYIYGQIINDYDQKTIVGASELSKDLKADLKSAKSKVEASKLVGIHLAKLAKQKKIENVVFDRNGYNYHGRVKALAEGAREGGLKF